MMACHLGIRLGSTEFIKRICHKGQLPHISIVCYFDLTAWHTQKTTTMTSQRIESSLIHKHTRHQLNFWIHSRDPFTNHWGYPSEHDFNVMIQTIKICFAVALARFVWLKQQTLEFHYCPRKFVLVWELGDRQEWHRAKKVWAISQTENEKELAREREKKTEKWRNEKCWDTQSQRENEEKKKFFVV